MTIVHRVLKEFWYDMDTGQLIAELGLDSRTFAVDKDVITQLRRQANPR